MKELEALPQASKPPTPAAFVMWANNWVEFVSLVIPVPYLGQVWFCETTHKPDEDVFSVQPGTSFVQKCMIMLSRIDTHVNMAIDQSLLVSFF